MLHVPDDWPECTTASLVEDLVHQANQRGQYAAAARAITRAALEYMLSSPRWMNRAERVMLLPHPLGFRINDWLFHVLPGIDAETLWGLTDLPRYKGEFDLIVPPGTESLVKSALTSLLPNFRVDVCSIDSYVCTRVHWTSLDLGHSNGASHVELLRRYQRLIRTIPSLRVDIDFNVAPTGAAVAHPRDTDVTALSPAPSPRPPRRTEDVEAIQAVVDFPREHADLDELGSSLVFRDGAAVGDRAQVDPRHREFLFNDDNWICHVTEPQMLAIIDHVLAALGDPNAIRRVSSVRNGDAAEVLARLRSEIEPQTPEGIQTKILRQLEAHVRRYDMICDDLWDREEPIRMVYNWCVNVIGRTPAKFSDISEYVQDALQELELD